MEKSLEQMIGELKNLKQNWDHTEKSLEQTIIELKKQIWNHIEKSLQQMITN